MTPTIEVLLNHRSIRQFTDEPIRDDQRQAIIASAQATSSSSFLQCTSIIRITDKAMREQLVGLTGGQQHVAQAAEFWVFCADFNRHLQIFPDAQLGLAEQLLLGVVDTALMAQNALTAAESLGRKATIHLKIDTGMERIGVHSYSCGSFVETAVTSKWCALKGIYSHLACADDPASQMTALQIERFFDACAHFERIGAPMPLRHLANSGGVLHFPATWLDMVRPGIVLYGVLPDPASQTTIDVRAALSLVSQVVYFKVVRAGNTVGYGATWTAPDDTRIATIPIGYGDGFPRALSSRGQVLIRGRRLPLVGRVCMDQFMVDLGADGTAYNEDDVVLIGAQGCEAIRVEDVARLADTIPYEILTGLNERIPREYFGA